MSFALIVLFLRPMESLLLEENISGIMGNPDASWWYERDRIMRQERTISFNAGQLRTGLEVIANQLGKKPDADRPLGHAQLPDGSRLAAVSVGCAPGSRSNLQRENPAHQLWNGDRQDWLISLRVSRRTNMPLLEMNQTRYISAPVGSMSPPQSRSIKTPLLSAHPPTMSWTKRSTMSSRKTVTSRTL